MMTKSDTGWSKQGCFTLTLARPPYGGHMEEDQGQMVEKHSYKGLYLVDCWHNSDTGKQSPFPYPSISNGTMQPCLHTYSILERQTSAMAWKGRGKWQNQNRPSSMHCNIWGSKEFGQMGSESAEQYSLEPIIDCFPVASLFSAWVQGESSYTVKEAATVKQGCYAWALDNLKLFRRPGLIQ